MNVVSTPLSHVLHQGILTITLERPTLDRAALDALEQALDAAADPAVGAVILAGAHPRGTGFGVDLPWLLQGLEDEASGAQAPGTLARWLRRGQVLARRLECLPVPTVGVMHGLVIGGALELMACVDVRVAEQGARVALPELAKGLWPGLGGAVRLARLLPEPVVRDLLLTGRTLGISRLHSLGAVSQVVATGEGVPTARRLAREAARSGPLAALAKGQLGPVPDDVLTADHELALERLGDPDTRRRLRVVLSPGGGR